MRGQTASMYKKASEHTCQNVSERAARRSVRSSHLFISILL